MLGKVEKHQCHIITTFRVKDKSLVGAPPYPGPDGVKKDVALLEKENGSTKKNTVNHFFLLL